MRPDRPAELLREVLTSWGVTTTASGKAAVFPQAATFTADITTVSTGDIPPTAGIIPKVRGITPAASSITPRTASITPVVTGDTPVTSSITPMATGMMLVAVGMSQKPAVVMLETTGMSPDSGGTMLAGKNAKKLSLAKETLTALDLENVEPVAGLAAYCPRESAVICRGGGGETEKGNTAPAEKRRRCCRSVTHFALVEKSLRSPVL